MYGMDRKQMIMAIILLGTILFGTGYKAAQIRVKSEIKPVIPINTGIREEKDKTRKVTVYIFGAVKKPGVYTFPEGARVVDGLNKAEPAPDAALEYINLAETMADGQPIPVPRKGEAEGSGQKPEIARNGTAAGMIVKSGKININTATKETLDSLPGVGPSTADKIIEYRSTHGKFKSVSDLLNVSGIGEKKLAKFKEKITI